MFRIKRVVVDGMFLSCMPESLNSIREYFRQKGIGLLDGAVADAQVFDPSLLYWPATDEARSKLIGQNPHARHYRPWVDLPTLRNLSHYPEDALSILRRWHTQLHFSQALVPVNEAAAECAPRHLKLSHFQQRHVKDTVVLMLDSTHSLTLQETLRRYQDPQWHPYAVVLGHKNLNNAVLPTIERSSIPCFSLIHGYNFGHGTYSGLVFGPASFLENHRILQKTGPSVCPEWPSLEGFLQQRGRA